MLGAELGVDAGSLVALAPLDQVRGGIEVDRVALLAFGAATGRVTGQLEGHGVGAQMFLLLGGASACYRATQDNPVLSGCGGIELGSLQASGFGASPQLSDGRAFWSAGFVRGALDWDITETSAASIGVTLAAPFRRLRVVLSPEEVHRVSAVAVRPFVGRGVRFR